MFPNFLQFLFGILLKISYLCTEMNKKELNNSLRTKAVSCGLCNDWQKEWRQDWNLDRMVSQFYRGIDFFINKRFMSNEFIKDNFDKDFLRRNGVLVDDAYSLLNPQNAILIGDSKATIRFNGYSTGTVNVLDNSDAKIVAKGDSFVMVHAYGNSQVNVEQKDKSKVVVVTHSKQCVVISDDNITLRGGK